MYVNYFLLKLEKRNQLYDFKNVLTNRIINKEDIYVNQYK